MKYLFLASLLILLSAKVIATNLPSNGMTKAQVRSQLGEPQVIKAAVGIPAISSWDYSDHSVYFENNRVIHSFIHNQLSIKTHHINEATGSPSVSATQETIIPVTQATNPQELTEELSTTTTQASDNTTPVLESTSTLQEPLDEALEEPVKETVERASNISAQIPEEVIEEALTEEPEEISEEAPEEILTESLETTKEVLEEEKKDFNFENKKTEQNIDFGKWGN